MGMLSLERILFDPADTADSSNIGSYTRAGSDGDLISSTLVSGKEGLDVNVINAALTVSATDLDIRDLSHTQDSVKVGDGTDFLAINADGSINVSAVDLDIRNLSHTQDSIKIGDGTDFLAVNTDGSINVVNQGTFLEDTAHVSGDRGNFMLGVRNDALAAFTSTDGDYGAVATDSRGRVWVNDAPNVAVLSTLVTVGATAVALPTSALAGRTRLTIQNKSDSKIYIGSAAVTTSGATTGLEVGKGNALTLEAGPSVTYYAIAGGAGNSVVVFEQA